MVKVTSNIKFMWIKLYVDDIKKHIKKLHSHNCHLVNTSSSLIYVLTITAIKTCTTSYIDLFNSLLT